MLSPKEITIDLKEKYHALAKDIPISFYRFPNIFMSKDCSYQKYVEIDGMLVILLLPPPEVGEPSALFPLGEGDLKKAVRLLKEEFGIARYTTLSADMRQKLEAACPGMFCFEDARDDYDYLYEYSALTELTGKKYHSKRNFITRFTMTYDYRFEELNEQTVRECIPILNEWYGAHPGYVSPLFDERQAIELLMHNFGALDLKAGAIRVGNKICAFSIGELIAPDTAHIIIEKADTSYQGAYAVINKEFLQNVWKGVELVNREEDMGMEGLRKAKLSYHPIKYNEVVNAVLKK